MRFSLICEAIVRKPRLERAGTNWQQLIVRSYQRQRLNPRARRHPNAGVQKPPEANSSLSLVCRLHIAWEYKRQMVARQLVFENRCHRSFCGISLEENVRVVSKLVLSAHG